jgi:hypothetical protein
MVRTCSRSDQDGSPSSSIKANRQSSYFLVISDDEADKVHLSTFPDYALGELSEVQLSLEKLYFECTGLQLDKGRVR